MSNPTQPSGHAVQPVDEYTIVIRAAWFAECRAAGLHTEPAMAQAFKVSRATIARIHAGGNVGHKVIAASLATLGPGKFNRLFKLAS